jgi:hypothetical protein
MKNILLLFIIVVFISSCKKKYNCHCSTTIITASLTQEYYVSKTKPMDAKMNKYQAKAVCDHEAENIKTTYVNLITNNGNYSSNGTKVTTNCILE